jgi:hypothetical protein
VGLNDEAEKLAACHAVNVENEAKIAELEDQLRRYQSARAVSEAQIADLEHENVRLESALGERLRHDAHGLAQAEAERDEARAALARLRRRVDPRVGDPTPITPADVRAILDETGADPVVAGRADWTLLDECRRLVAAIRTAIPEFGDLERRLDLATAAAAAEEAR